MIWKHKLTIRIETSQKESLAMDENKWLHFMSTKQSIG